MRRPWLQLLPVRVLTVAWQRLTVAVRFVVLRWASLTLVVRMVRCVCLDGDMVVESCVLTVVVSLVLSKL